MANIQRNPQYFRLCKNWQNVDLIEICIFSFNQLAPSYPYPGGICHGDDLIYLFPTFNLHDRDRRMSRKMVDLWTSFAIRGVPNADWPPLECSQYSNGSKLIRILYAFVSLWLQVQARI